MNHHIQLAMPWSRPGIAYSAPGGLVVKLPLGEAPDHIPAISDVRAGRQSSVTSFGLGSIDRTLVHFTNGQMEIARVHNAAAAHTRRGPAHVGYDALEHACGLSRTFYVDVDRACPIAEMVDALRQLSAVEEVHPDYLCVVPFAVHAPAADAAAGLGLDAAWLPREQVAAAEALAYEPGDPAVIVGIIDTGVAHEHPELRDRLRHGRDTVQLTASDLPQGLRLQAMASTNDDDDVADLVGHGTSCAAIVGAAGDAIPPGLAGACSVLPVRVLGPALFPGRRDPVGVGSIMDIDRGVKAGVDLGAKVLNLSFGTPTSTLEDGEIPPHTDVIRYGLMRGCVMVAASGNSGREERFSPASLDGVIAVGAVNGDGEPTAFSTRGDHVALCAPGERVVSAGLQGYSMVTGTSFAAPFVTAAAALLISRAEARGQPLDAQAVKRVLTESAHRWPVGQDHPGHGSGVLDAHAALMALDRAIDASQFDEQLGQPTAQSQDHRRRVG